MLIAYSARVLHDECQIRQALLRCARRRVRSCAWHQSQPVASQYEVTAGSQIWYHPNADKVIILGRRSWYSTSRAHLAGPFILPRLDERMPFGLFEPVVEHLWEL